MDNNIKPQQNLFMVKRDDKGRPVSVEYYECPNKQEGGNKISKLKSTEARLIIGNKKYIIYVDPKTSIMYIKKNSKQVRIRISY